MKEPTYESVSQYFHLPIVEASIKLKMETKELQKIIKEAGLKRWPYSYKQQVSIRKKRNEVMSALSFNQKEEIVYKTAKGIRIEIKNLLN